MIKMNENKRMLMLFGVIILIVIIILVISFWPEPDKTFACNVKKEGDYTKLASITYEDYECLKDESNVVLAIGDLNNKEKNSLNSAGVEAGVGIYYVSEEVSKGDLNKIKKDLNYTKNAFEKDVLLVVNKGKVTTYKEDILNKSEEVYDFLDESGVTTFACNVKPSEEYANLGVLTYDNYECLLDSDKPFALVIAQTTCSYCQEYAPVINEYAGENNVPIYLVYLDELGNDANKLLSSLSYFNENQDWGTPLSLGIDNKEVIATISGYTDDKNEIDNFMKQTGIK